MPRDDGGRPSPPDIHGVEQVGARLVHSEGRDIDSYAIGGGRGGRDGGAGAGGNEA